MEKKLTKSVTDKKICGVLSGIAEYINTDPTLIRIAFVLLTFFSFGLGGIILYIVMACIMPDGHKDIV